MSRKIISYVLILVFVVLIGAYFVGRAGLDKNGEVLSAYFQEQMITVGVAEVGQPIEGFDGFLLMMAYPGLVSADFENVKTLEGHYEGGGGELKFVRDALGPITSAEMMVTDEGYETLLENVSKRLDVTVVEKSDVDVIVAQVDMQGGGEEPVFCAADAFQCPDGTWVGRTGPNCEFVCPAE